MGNLPFEFATLATPCANYIFLNFQRSIQSALQQVRHLCIESQKKKFMDLFALADSGKNTSLSPLSPSPHYSEDLISCPEFNHRTK